MSIQSALAPDLYAPSNAVLNMQTMQDLRAHAKKSVEDRKKNIIVKAGNQEFLNREAFQYRSKELNSFYDFTLIIMYIMMLFIIATIVVSGIQLVAIKDDLERQDIAWRKALEVLISFLAVLLFLSLLYNFYFPYTKVKASINLVKAMTNLYAEDSANNSVHQAMGDLMTTNKGDAESLTSYLMKRYQPFEKHIITSMNGTGSGLDTNFQSNFQDKLDQLPALEKKAAEERSLELRKAEEERSLELRKAEELRQQKQLAYENEKIKSTALEDANRVTALNSSVSKTFNDDDDGSKLANSIQQLKTAREISNNLAVRTFGSNDAEVQDATSRADISADQAAKVVKQHSIYKQAYDLIQEIKTENQEIKTGFDTGDSPIDSINKVNSQLNTLKSLGSQIYDSRKNTIIKEEFNQEISNNINAIDLVKIKNQQKDITKILSEVPHTSSQHEKDKILSQATTLYNDLEENVEKLTISSYKDIGDEIKNDLLLEFVHRSQ